MGMLREQRHLPESGSAWSSVRLLCMEGGRRQWEKLKSGVEEEEAFVFDDTDREAEEKGVDRH